MFPELLNWMEATAEEIREWLVAAQAAVESTFASEELTDAEKLEAMTSQVASIEEARAALAVKETEGDQEPEPEPDPEPEVVSQLEALAVQARGETPEPDPEPEPEPEPEPQVSPEPVVAAVPLGRSARSTPKPQARRLSLVASAEGIGYPLGGEIPDETALAAAMIQKRFNFGHMTAREDVPIARLDWSDSYPEERRISPRDGEQATTAKVNALLASLRSDPNKLTDKSLVAAGGICAPLTPFYDLQVISQADRPVRASLPSMQADRGGIRFAAPPALGAVTTAIGRITSAQDAAGGTQATKTCQTLTCPPWSEVAIEILYHCVRTSNLTYRTFPEQLAQFNQLVMAAQARDAESFLLDQISAGSVHVTAADIGVGAAPSLLTEVLVAAAGIRSRNRMNPEAVVRVMIPDWALDLMVSDVLRGQFGRFDTDEQRVVALLRQQGVEPTFYLDTETAMHQVFGVQGAGALIPFPATVVWYAFPEGTWIYLDGGALELGLVRDSVLNATNEFQVFGETFENVAKVGVESLRVVSTVCDNGKTAGTGTVTCGNFA